jgi:predicted nuclease of predicted toxin-antitoxin system
MKFLLDENFPRSSATLIESCGHEAVLFNAVCNFGDNDETVFAVAQRLDATILTSDRDFYHTMPLLHPSHAGIVVVALRQPNRAAIHARLKWFMENVEEPLRNRVFVLRDFSCRSR